MKRVLIVAYYFPPLGGIGSLRVASFARHLPDYGWEVTVLAPRNGAYFRDETLAFPESQVIRSPSIELSRAGKQLLRAGGTDVEAATVGRGRATLKQLARRYLYFPDAQIGWMPPALITARQRVRPGEFDAVFSSSFPITAHLVARRLHRRLAVPWVAEFRDPWTAMMPASSPTLGRARRLEAAIGREASAVLTVSPSWAAMFGDAWAREVSVIPNGHDQVPGAHDAPEPHDTPELHDTHVPHNNHEHRAPIGFTLGYLGTFYPDTQDLSVIWSAVAEINGDGDTRPVDGIRFIGNGHPKLLAELDGSGLSSLVSSTGFLPHEQALTELGRCSVLLVAGPRDGRAALRGHVVAKLSEYLAIPRPIIYVGHPDTDAADLVRRFPGTHVVTPGDLPGAVAAIRAAREQRVERDASELSRQALTGRLAQILDGASRT